MLKLDIVVTDEGMAERLAEAVNSPASCLFSFPIISPHSHCLQQFFVSVDAWQECMHAMLGGQTSVITGPSVLGPDNKRAGSLDRLSNEQGSYIRTPVWMS